MCVSYPGLNKVTKHFEYPTPRCDDAITLILLGSNTIYIITVDSKQGCHQIDVYVLHQDKLASFAPNNRKYVFKIMPFGPINALEFYTFMVQDFHSEWDLILVLTIHNTTEIGGEPVHVTDTTDIYVGNRKTYSGSKVIIDDILAYSTNIELVLIYF